jgi:hypothetical protein
MIENAVDGSSFPVEIIIDNEKIFDDKTKMELKFLYQISLMAKLISKKLFNLLKEI